jgi:hypothetical protein
MIWMPPTGWVLPRRAVQHPSGVALTMSATRRNIFGPYSFFVHEGEADSIEAAGVLPRIRAGRG